MDAGTLHDCSAEELQEALTQFEAGRCAVHQAELDLIEAFEEKALFRLEGAASMPAWLCLKFGWSSRQAYQVVRVARALARLPLIRDAYGQGRICWESVVALSRIADRDNEAELLDHALRMPSTDLKALLANLDQVHTPEANRAHEQRFLRYHWDVDSGVLHLKGMLADVDGVVVAKALEHLAGRRDPGAAEAGSEEQAGSVEPESALALAYDPTPRPSFEQACADALVELSSTYLDVDGDSVRSTVVVHVDIDRFDHYGTGIAALDDGPMIAGSTALRLACDCQHELVIEGPDHKPIGIGRRSRQIPGWLWRVLKHRDQTCRFPGCDRARWVQGHHIKHWTKDGPTDTDNLVLLCWFHHRLVHEGGWRIKGNPDEWLDFVNPYGEILTSLPPPAVEPELRDGLLDLFWEDHPPWEAEPDQPGP